MERLQAKLKNLSAIIAWCALSGGLAVVSVVSLTKWRKRKHELGQSCAKSRLVDNDSKTCSDATHSNCEEKGYSSPSTPLNDLLTVVLTTSAIPSHPSTYLLDETLKSMRLASGVLMCPLIITCDGYKQCAEGVESRCRMGIVNPDLAKRYEEYKQTLRDRQMQGEFDLLELTERHGFGFAVRATLPKIKTPYVLIMQHDRAFVRSVDIERLVRLMEEHDKVKYLGMPTATTLHHQYHVLSKYGIRVAPEAVAPGLTITPLIQWYDSAHLARTDYYRNFVFGSKHLVARGGFIEDKLGQKQLHDIRTIGLAAHKEYGTYILNDSVDEPIVLHLDGRDSRHLAHAK